MKFLFLVFLAAAFLVPFADAQAALVPCGAAQDDPATPFINEAKDCGLCDAFQLINNVIRFFLFPAPGINNGFAVVPLLATLFIVAGAFFLLIGGGNPGMHQRGRAIITSVVVGLIIVYTAWALVNTFLSFLGVTEWTGLVGDGWWHLSCSLPR